MKVGDVDGGEILLAVQDRRDQAVGVGAGQRRVDCRNSMTGAWSFD
jgi:hypothetical protein